MNLYGFLCQLFYFRQDNKTKKGKTDQPFVIYVKLKATLKISSCYVRVFTKCQDSLCTDQRSLNFMFVLWFLLFMLFSCQGTWALLGMGKIYSDYYRLMLILS